MTTTGLHGGQTRGKRRVGERPDRDEATQILTRHTSVDREPKVTEFLFFPSDSVPGGKSDKPSVLRSARGDCGTFRGLTGSVSLLFFRHNGPFNKLVGETSKTGIPNIYPKFSFTILPCIINFWLF